MSLLKQYLQQQAKAAVSTEDHDDGTGTTPVVGEAPEVAIPDAVEVSPVEDIEAQDALDEVVEERLEEAREEERRAAIIEDGEVLAESLENYIDVLSVGIEQGEFSPQFAAMAGTELRRVSTLLGKDMSEVVSFEDYAHDQLEGFYTESLEGFKEALASVKGSLTAVAKSAHTWVKELGTNEKAAKALTTRADALLGKVGDMTDARTVKLGGLGATFSQNGQVPNNLLQAITGDIRALDTLAKKHTSTAVDYYVMAVNAAVVAVNKPDDISAVAKKLASQKTPSETMGNLPLLGKGLAIGDAPKGQLNEQIVKGLVEKINAEADVFGKAKKASADVSLSKAEVEGLIKAAKGYAAILTSLDRDAKAAAAKQSKVDQDIADALEKHGTAEGKSEKNDIVTPGVAGYAIGIGAVALGVSLVPTMAVAGLAGGFLHWNSTRTTYQKNESSNDKAIRELRNLISVSSRLPKASFKAISNELEDKARACLKLAERALAAKAINSNEEKELAEVEGNAPA